MRQKLQMKNAFYVMSKQLKVYSGDHKGILSREDKNREIK